METGIGLENLEAALEWTIKLDVTKGDVPEDLQKMATIHAASAVSECLERYWNRDLRKYEWPE